MSKARDSKYQQGANMNEFVQNDLNDEEDINFKEIESELIANRAEALSAAANLNLNTDTDNTANNKNTCLNDASEANSILTTSNCN